MNLDIAIPRQTLILLIASLLSSLLLHTQYLPIWFYVIALFVLGWRVAVYLGYVSFPGRWAKTATVVASTILVYQLNAGQITLEGSASFLVAAGLLKILEMARRRDAIIMVFLSFFIQATGFLFEQGILAALSGIVTLGLATMAMISTQAIGYTGVPKALPVFRTASAIMVLALPFMLVLYFLFPRIGPLWSVPLQSESSITGLGTSMTPGDVSRLSQSDELAFRATFSGERPSQSELYWRVMVMDEYDGRTWRISDRKIGTDWEITDAAQSTQPYQYEVIQEPTGRGYLFSLSGAASHSVNVGVTRQGLLVARQPVFQRLRYQVSSSGELEGYYLAKIDEPVYLDIPEKVNPKTRVWAESLLASYAASGADLGFDNKAEFLAAKIVQYFSGQSFTYTLKPPAYGEQDIDEFLFSDQRGFCAHYASAMTFTLRAAGIPARLVTGYQGGEWSPEGYLSVRQYDAHAWVEVWNGVEWLRYDPTAAVSPDRIEWGLEQAMAAEGSFLADKILSPHRFKAVNWLNNLRLEWENLNYQWSRWVLSYDSKRQSEVLKKWLSIHQYEEALYFIAGTIAVIFTLSSLILWWMQRADRPSPLVENWGKLRAQLAKSEIQVNESDAPLSTLSLISTHWPHLNLEVEHAKVLLTHYQYLDDASKEKALIKQIKRLRRKARPSSKVSSDSIIQQKGG